MEFEICCTSGLKSGGGVIFGLLILVANSAQIGESGAVDKKT